MNSYLGLVKNALWQSDFRIIKTWKEMSQSAWLFFAETDWWMVKSDLDFKVGGIKKALNQSNCRIN